MRYVLFHGIEVDGDLSKNCAFCRKPWGAHRAKDFACPVGRKTKAGHVSYDHVRSFRPRLPKSDLRAVSNDILASLIRDFLDESSLDDTFSPSEVDVIHRSLDRVMQAASRKGLREKMDPTFRIPTDYDEEG